MTVSLNGIAHIQLTVNDPARCLPFWEALCFVLIGGLASSTFLVLTAFPAMYLGEEKLRSLVKSLFRTAWSSVSRRPDPA